MTRKIKGIVVFGMLGAMGSGGAIIADQTSNSYTREDTYYVDRKQSVVQGARENKVKISTTEPKVEFSRWNEEMTLGIRYDAIQASGNRVLFTDRIEWTNGSTKMEVTPLESSPQNEDGGYKIDLILSTPPSSNQFDFQLEGTENLAFSYQDALDRENPDKNCTATECFNEAGEVIVYRPENVVGSYAVYHSTNRDHHGQGVNYATGKVYHIYRPKIFDANQQEVWGQLSYKEGVLTVTVPQEFLERATYPVTIDPDVGYTTIGGTQNDGETVVNGIRATPGTAGTINSVTAYLRETNSANTHRYRYALYNDSASSPADNVSLVANTTSAEGQDVATTGAWKTQTISGGASLGAGTNYIVCVQMSGGGGTMNYYSDTETDAGRGAATPTSITTPLTFDDPESFGAWNTRKASIYFTYTENVAAPTVATSTHQIILPANYKGELPANYKWVIQ